MATQKAMYFLGQHNCPFVHNYSTTSLKSFNYWKQMSMKVLVILIFHQEKKSPRDVYEVYKKLKIVAMAA